MQLLFVLWSLQCCFKVGYTWGSISETLRSQGPATMKWADGGCSHQDLFLTQFGAPVLVPTEARGPRIIGLEGSCMSSSPTPSPRQETLHQPRQRLSIFSWEPLTLALPQLQQASCNSCHHYHPPDCCNVLHMGLAFKMLWKLPLVQNAMACCWYIGSHQHGHIRTVLQALSCLSVNFKTIQNPCSQSFQAMPCLPPKWLQEFLSALIFFLIYNFHKLLKRKIKTNTK